MKATCSSMKFRLIGCIYLWAMPKQRFSNSLFAVNSLDGSRLRLQSLHLRLFWRNISPKIHIGSSVCWPFHSTRHHHLLLRKITEGTHYWSGSITFAQLHLM